MFEANLSIVDDVTVYLTNDCLSFRALVGSIEPNMLDLTSDAIPSPLFLTSKVAYSTLVDDTGFTEEVRGGVCLLSASAIAIMFSD